MSASIRTALVVAMIAIVHAGLFAWYQRADWDTQWTDQEGYRRLGDALARTGRFTRYPDAHPFVPEVLRTPGYPAFVALVYRAVGTGHEAVAFVQALVFAGICLVVMRLARGVAGADAAIAAGLLTALYSPLPYFAALILTELWTGFLLTVATWRSVVMTRTNRVRDYALAGVVFALVALSRPAFVLLPLFVIAGGLIVPAKTRPVAVARWAALVAAFGLTLAPWLAYNYVYLHQLTMSPAGGVGRSMWEGSWQGAWNGRTEATLTGIAASPDDLPAVERRVHDLAAASGDDPAMMMEYIRQWRAVRAMWDTPTDPAARAAARVDADREYLRLAVQNDRRDWAGYVKRRLVRGIVLLWAGDIPIRYSEINQTPRSVIRAMWLLQGVLALAALYGFRAIRRAGDRSSAALLAAPLVYITLVHLPLTTEPRLALPGKPILLALAGIGFAAARGRTHPAAQPLTSQETSAA